MSLRFEKADVHAFMIEERQAIYDELYEKDRDLTLRRDMATRSTS